MGGAAGTGGLTLAKVAVAALFYLTRPQLEPIDRAQAEACLGGLPQAAAAELVAELVQNEPTLAGLLARVVEEAGATSATRTR